MKRKKQTVGNMIVYGNLVSKSPECNWTIISKPSLLRRILGEPFGSWDIVGFNKVKR